MRLGIALLILLAFPNSGSAADVTAGPPTNLSVTIYRSPYGGTGGVSLEALGGFGLVTETRRVDLPAGLSRLSFQGVADGIEASSAIVTGLPAGVIEKNRDAHLLSPASLVAAAVGKEVTLVRTDRKSGKTIDLKGAIRSDAGDGIVFESAEGVEALRCSGLPETFAFDRGLDGVSARPTLSVLTRSDRPIRATVTLSYLARNFDWTADYVATLSADRRTIDLGAWVTLANGNGTGFPDSRTQVVAGLLNRATGNIDPFGMSREIQALCWPRGSTSDRPQRMTIALAQPSGVLGRKRSTTELAPMAIPMAMIAPRNDQVEEEQLGDLKLYRVPTRTNVAGREIKQVRLLDKRDIPVERFYWIRFQADVIFSDYLLAEPRLRFRNDAAHHLGLPLPSGRVDLFEASARGTFLVAEAVIKDTTLQEEVELSSGPSDDVQVRQVQEYDGGATQIPLVPGVVAAPALNIQDPIRIEVASARPEPIKLEIKLELSPQARLIRADPPVVVKDGQPMFRLEIPAHGKAIVRYQLGF